jgi:hypothetical protein
MAWIRVWDPEKRFSSRTFDSEAGLELLNVAGGPEYHPYKIVRMDDHEDIVIEFGGTYERRPLTRAEKRAYPHAQKCVFYQVSEGYRRSVRLSGYSLEEGKSIIYNALLTHEIMGYSPEALKKYKLDVVFFI